MLNNIYLLLPADIADFNKLNALPENNRGPQVLVMSYQNNSNRSSVKMIFTGTANAVIPAGYMFSDALTKNLWITSAPITLDVAGNASDVYVECWTVGPIVALSATLTNKITSNQNVTSVTNVFDAVVAGEAFDSCVDQSTIQDPLYQPWTDAMEANQPIATREVICIETGS